MAPPCCAAIGTRPFSYFNKLPLAELEETRTTAEEELAGIRGRKQILEQLGRDRDALLESYAQMTPEALDALTPEERRQVYGMLRLRVEVAADGTMQAQGILSENISVQDENGSPVSEGVFCEHGLVSPTNAALTPLPPWGRSPGRW
jgi:hypothetical protein